MNLEEKDRIRENMAAAGDEDDFHVRMELTDGEKREFQQLYQEGIYRELYQMNLLTEYQLSELLNRLYCSCACDPEGTDLW